MTHKEMNWLANILRKHGSNRDLLIDTIGFNLIPVNYRDDWKRLANGQLPRI